MSKNFDDLYGGKFLSAADIDEAGFVGTVESVNVEKMKDGSEKAVIVFEDRDRGIVLNKSRARAMLDLTGSKDFDDWVGVKVRVVAGETQFGGDTVPCINFRKPPVPKKALKDDLNDEIPIK
jgi:hypothetical protein